MPGGGPTTRASAQEIKRDTEMAECMREHSVTGFPDPIVTATPPPSTGGQYSEAEYVNGIFIGIPKSIRGGGEGLQLQRLSVADTASWRLVPPDPGPQTRPWFRLPV
jgi:hypothetical protein